jgi:hypothetical protein
MTDFRQYWHDQYAWVVKNFPVMQPTMDLMRAEIQKQYALAGKPLGDGKDADLIWHGIHYHAWKEEQGIDEPPVADIPGLSWPDVLEEAVQMADLVKSQEGNETLYVLTVKGACRTLADFLDTALANADTDQRDFNGEEISALQSVLIAVGITLQQRRRNLKVA